MTTQEFIDAIKGMSVLELNDLVKACEEEFGVSAAAGVVVAAAGAGAAAAEEKTEFDVELTELRLHLSNHVLRLLRQVLRYCNICLFFWLIIIIKIGIIEV